MEERNIKNGGTSPSQIQSKSSKERGLNSDHCSKLFTDVNTKTDPIIYPSSSNNSDEVFNKGGPTVEVPSSSASVCKIKSQQTQIHQFRAPQQYVKHKKSSISVFKKSKSWNKRQNKNGKISIPNVCYSHLPVQTSATADVENIQNLRNQAGVLNQRICGTSDKSASVVENLTQTSIADKQVFNYSQIKQQTYKKMLLHNRSHHHQVLCAGASHVGNIPINCCHISGCVGHSSKDVIHNSTLGSSVNGNIVHCCLRSKFFLSDKRPRKEVIVPPTKFLLGGNISDPLNLNSLQNETAYTSSNNTLATTPRRSPITTPPKVEVIIPPNIHDPLHLLDPVDTMEYEKQLTSPMKRSVNTNAFRHHKHRHRKNRKTKRRRNDSFNSNTTSRPFRKKSESETIATKTSILSQTSPDYMLQTDINMTNTEAKSSPAFGVASNSSLLLPIKEDKNREKKSSKCMLENSKAVLQTIFNSGVVNISDNGCKENSTSHKIGGDENQIEKIETKDVSKLKETKLLNLISNDDLISPKISIHLDNADILQKSNKERSLIHSPITLFGTENENISNIFSTISANNSTIRKRNISENSNSSKTKKQPRFESMDKIVSPVVPQPGAWKRPPRLAATGARKSSSKRASSTTEVESQDNNENLAKMKAQSTHECESPSLIPLNIKSQNLESTSGALDSSNKKKGIVEISNNFKITSNSVESKETDNIRKNHSKYCYGNYDRYGSFRDVNEFTDVRLQIFQRNVELFENKDILDIGCNSGYISISIGRNFAPKSVLGIDIDENLIWKARRNLALHVRIPNIEATCSHEDSKYLPRDNPKKQTNEVSTKKSNRMRNRRLRSKINFQMQSVNNIQSFVHQPQNIQIHYKNFKLRELKQNSNNIFPMSFPSTYGSIFELNSLQALSATLSKTTPGLNTEPFNPTLKPETVSKTDSLTSSKDAASFTGCTIPPGSEFPNNVVFRQTNYVLKDEALLANENQIYDVIICLSVTKWIHLNYGDSGLKLAFKRMFNQLRPGGKLILEAQNWASYKKKRNFTDNINLNYKQIEFFPNKFHEYLLSSEVGFSHSYSLGVPRHLNKGFCRPIQLYAKGDFTPNHIRWSDAYYPQTPYEAYRGIYATMPPRPVVCQRSSSRSQAFDTPHYIGGASSGTYSCRQTPMHYLTSQYYNPLETDSYQPSYDMEYLNHMYVFASPLYQTVWSPPASLRRTSSTHTPIYGSVREADTDGDGLFFHNSGSNYHRHVYPPNDDTLSPNANSNNAFNSIRDSDTDDANQMFKRHVYATNCGEGSCSSNMNHTFSEFTENGSDITKSPYNDI